MYLHTAATIKLTSGIFPFTYYLYIELMQTKNDSSHQCVLELAYNWLWEPIIKIFRNFVSGGYNTAIIQT